MDSFFAELKRRNVFRVAGVYAVVGWLLAQVSTTLEETLSLPAWFDSLIVAILLLGLPIALILAWAFELTPEGVVRTEAVPEAESITPKTGRKLDYAIVGGLILLGGLILWQQASREPVADSQPPVAAHMQPAPESSPMASIAVLPFADLSPAADQEYFSDGIAEEILNVLVRVNGLDVTSRTSSFQFKGRDVGIPEIAKELSVRHVVEGSVRKSGETIRVTAQLIDASNDKHLWSETYDRPLTTENIFDIQDDIATSIVDALRTTLGVRGLEPVDVAPATRDLTAYDLYLKARPLFQARVDLDVADDLLTRAVKQDPNYAKAWEMRSALQTLVVEYGYSDEPIEVAEQRSKQFADRALSIEPRSATALAVIAKVDGEAAGVLRSKTDLARVIADFTRALEIEPRNTEALNWRGLRFLMVGDLEAALRDFATCLGYEPYYVPCVENHYTVLAAMGRDEEALAAYIKALDTSSAKVQFAHLPLLARLDKELAFKSTTNSPSVLWGWRRHDELWRAYRNPEQDHSDLIRSIQGFIGAQSGAFDDLADFIVHPLGTEWRIPERLLLWDASMKRYRQTEAFKAYIRDSGAYDYWRTAGFPPQCRPVGNADFACD